MRPKGDSPIGFAYRHKMSETRTDNHEVEFQLLPQGARGLVAAYHLGLQALQPGLMLDSKNILVHVEISTQHEGRGASLGPPVNRGQDLCRWFVDMIRGKQLQGLTKPQI